MADIGEKVTFKHPATGEDTEGHITGEPGPRGVTVTDGKGDQHKLDHGSYLRNTRPDADLVKVAARKHIELAMTTPLAVQGLAMLLCIGGVSPVHTLETSDISFEGDMLYDNRDKLKTSDPGIVKAARELAELNPKGLLFQVDGAPVTEGMLTAYVRKFGIAPSKPPAMTVTGAGAAAKAPDDAANLAKAAAGALDLPSLTGEMIATWNDQGFSVDLRKADNGLQVVSVFREGMAMPWHEIVSNKAEAHKESASAIAMMKTGKAPRRGIFHRLAAT